MTTLWATIVVIGVLVFVHELGHYLAARAGGVRVDSFFRGVSTAIYYLYFGSPGLDRALVLLPPGVFW